jgi:SH3-like domain-containing protein
MQKGRQHIKALLLAGVLGLALLPGPAFALEYRSVASSRAVLYDAPSAQGKKLFVVGQGYPVEVIVNLGSWVKVRDRHGTLSWIEAKDITPSRTLIVTASQAEIHEAADAASKIVFRTEKDVVLEMLEPSNPAPVGKAWVKVRHRDGLTGYILSSAIWGY